jgi:sugar/nucleoside kinase (ribokinase family)
MTERPPYRILGVGNACIDLLLPIEEDFLAHVPGAKGGSQAITSEQLHHLITLSGTTPLIAAGGSCANTIKGLTRLGEPCALLSYIGKDKWGDYFSHHMQKLGIVDFFSPSPSPTTCALCLITPDGHRTMRFCGGSMQDISDQFLQPTYFKHAHLVHLDSYSLRNDHLVQRALSLAKEAGAKISLDLSSFEIVHAFHSTFLELLPKYVDLIFANEDEAHALTGRGPEESCLVLQELCSIAVILRGKEGCLVGHQGRLIYSSGFPVEVIDSTGAGDLFASGFIYGYLQGYSLEKCARLGNRLGSQVVQVQGAEIPPEQWPLLKTVLNQDGSF